MSLGKPLIAAGLLVVGTVGALVYFGRQSESADSASKARVEEVGSKSNSAALSQGPKPNPPPVAGGAIRHRARALVPQEAWLVADFRGDLTGTRPFEDQEGFCKTVPAPPRVALAILPPLSDSQSGPELMLAAPEVEETFWGCARDRIVRAGGTVLAQNGQFEVLKSPSGIVALGPARAMIFLSSEGHLERGLAVISDLETSAASRGVHAGLFRRMYPSGKRGEHSALDVTIFAPQDWLSSVGNDAKLTPLRHLQAAYLSVKDDGNAVGGVDCVEPGCKDLFQFLKGAKGDLSGRLPVAKRALIEGALQLSHVEGSGSVDLSWSSKDVRIQDLLSGFFSGPGLF